MDTLEGVAGSGDWSILGTHSTERALNLDSEDLGSSPGSITSDFAVPQFPHL